MRVIIFVFLKALWGEITAIIISGVRKRQRRILSIDTCIEHGNVNYNAMPSASTIHVAATKKKRLVFFRTMSLMRALKWLVSNCFGMGWPIFCDSCGQSCTQRRADPPRQLISCHVMSCHVIWCHAMSCFVNVYICKRIRLIRLRSCILRQLKITTLVGGPRILLFMMTLLSWCPWILLKVKHRNNQMQMLEPASIPLQSFKKEDVLFKPLNISPAKVRYGTFLYVFLS